MTQTVQISKGLYLGLIAIKGVVIGHIKKKFVQIYDLEKKGKSESNSWSKVMMTKLNNVSLMAFMMFVQA